MTNEELLQSFSEMLDAKLLSFTDTLNLLLRRIDRMQDEIDEIKKKLPLSQKEGDTNVIDK